MDYQPSVHGVLRARILKWFAIPFSRLQQYMNHELPDVQAGFRKGRGARDQIANIRWIIEKARKFQKNICFCFIAMPKPLTVLLLLLLLSCFSCV